MQGFELRTIEEEKDLSISISKLFNFLKTETFKAMGMTDGILLIEQLAAMREYSRILNKRIERFGK